MKIITIVLFPAMLLGVCSCKKSVDNGTASTVDSVVLSCPGLHKSETQAYQFDGARLIRFIRTINDSTANAGTLATEVQAHVFVYSGKGASPGSVNIADTVYTAGGPTYYDYPLGFTFSYGSFGRLVGNLISLWGGEVNAANVRNPLYDGGIAGTFASFFLIDPPEFLTPPSYFSFPIDFVSQHLQSAADDVVEGAQLTFSWSADGSGKVVSGVITGLQGGSAFVRFFYRP
jgi:hypothetical protein